MESAVNKGFKCATIILSKI